MGIDGAEFQEKFDKDFDAKGRKRVKFVSPDRGDRVRLEMEKQAKEGSKLKEKSNRIVMEKINRVMEKDESGDGREVKAYFEWLRLGLLCIEEIDSIKSRGSGEVELAGETMIKESDLDQKFVRSQGPGGQNTNKVASAVQLKHVPSGIFVKVQDSRDQAENRVRAKQRLQEKLEEHLTNWKIVIGEGDENMVMAEALDKAVEKNGSVEGVRGDILTNTIVNLREGRDLK